MRLHEHRLASAEQAVRKFQNSINQCRLELGTALESYIKSYPQVIAIMWFQEFSDNFYIHSGRVFLQKEYAEKMNLPEELRLAIFRGVITEGGTKVVQDGIIEAIEYLWSFLYSNADVIHYCFGTNKVTLTSDGITMSPIE